VSTFERHDEARLQNDHDSHTDQEKMIYLAKKAAKELEELFNQDAASEQRGRP
jgi:hypothetical protein